MLKDSRVFWRDPAQWSQVMIFFGLLTIYVLNLRNVSFDLHSAFWSTMVSYLNLTACALTLSTLTTRFRLPAVLAGGSPASGFLVWLRSGWAAC